MNHLPAHLQQIIESLCLDGCKQVRQQIQAIEQGHLPQPMQSISQTDCHLILEELKAIMAVYDRCEF